MLMKIVFLDPFFWKVEIQLDLIRAVVRTITLWYFFMNLGIGDDYVFFSILKV